MEMAKTADLHVAGIDDVRLAELAAKYANRWASPTDKALADISFTTECESPFNYCIVGTNLGNLTGSEIEEAIVYIKLALQKVTGQLKFDIALLQKVGRRVKGNHQVDETLSEQGMQKILLDVNRTHGGDFQIEMIRVLR
jgi:hypothetical protein